MSFSVHTATSIINEESTLSTISLFRDADTGITSSTSTSISVGKMNLKPILEDVLIIIF